MAFAVTHAAWLVLLVSLAALATTAAGVGLVVWAIVGAAGVE